MNKDTLQNIVSGLLSVILGILGFLLSTAYGDIRELKHEIDLHKSSSEQRLQQAESELNDLWGKYNMMIDRGVDRIEADFDEHIELRERLTKLEAQK
jgi:hypothetical protein